VSAQVLLSQLEVQATAAATAAANAASRRQAVEQQQEELKKSIKVTGSGDWRGFVCCDSWLWHSSSGVRSSAFVLAAATQRARRAHPAHFPRGMHHPCVTCAPQAEYERSGDGGAAGLMMDDGGGYDIMLDDAHDGPHARLGGSGGGGGAAGAGGGGSGSGFGSSGAERHHGGPGLLGRPKR
jgi:hypothetical protein